MKIEFEKESAEIIANLKYAGYHLDCERVILYNIKKLFEMGLSEQMITGYMEKLFLILENLSKSTEDVLERFNYKHSAHFLNSLQSTPYWRNWIKARQLKIDNVNGKNDDV
jgi:hypothetical protein